MRDAVQRRHHCGERLGYQRVPLVLRDAECLASAVLDNLPFSDPRTLAPIYAREPDAVTLWRARHPPPPAPSSGA